ncbi:MAG TPA: GntR family transcriptional regulator YhfZ [Ktedonobacteraceae bacterium]
MTLSDTKEFLSQTGKVTMGVAGLLLHCAEGEKLPRMMDLARTLKSGHGTIQDAFSYLVKSGAITVEARGAQGSYLIAADYTRLWRYAGNEWIVGSMPLPYTLRYEGLATALYAQLEMSKLPFNMTYQRGSLSRGDMVRKGHYHFAVMSMLAAEHFVKQHPDVMIVAQLPGESYVSEHVLVSRVPREHVHYIGVDFTSLDEKPLTEDESSLHSSWETVPITRAQVLDLLQEEQFDAVIWNQDGVQTAPENVVLLPLLGDAQKRKLASQTAIIALKDGPVCNVLKGIFSPGTITTVQKEVLERHRQPRY